MDGTSETVCYCFGVTAADLAADRQAGVPLRSFEAIAARCRAGEARCSEKNPAGVCCLSAVQARIQALGGGGTAADESAVESPIGRNCCAAVRVKGMPLDANKGNAE